MSERIKSLAIQSGVVESNVDWENAGGDLLEKFAELIIKDCVEQTRNIPTRQEYLGGQMFKYVQVGEVVDSIRLHFGVDDE